MLQEHTGFVESSNLQFLETIGNNEQSGSFLSRKELAHAFSPFVSTNGFSTFNQRIA
jgi:hypothetical protein